MPICNFPDQEKTCDNMGKVHGSQVLSDSGLSKQVTLTVSGFSRLVLNLTDLADLMATSCMHVCCVRVHHLEMPKAFVGNS